jgi:D-serine deaminase-like pyridoxal phosphate-dependent protein
MERPIFKSLGTAVADLDTPALVVDMSLLERNLETLHSFFQRQQARVRPYVTAHRCPAIAHKQLAAGGTVGGIAVTTVGEAEVFAEHGFTDIFVANEVVTAAKIRRLCALAQRATITVAVDQARNVADLAAAASSHGVTLRVVVDIHTSANRCGVAPGQPAVTLAQTVRAAPGLAFVGLMGYESVVLSDDAEARTRSARHSAQQVLDTRQLLEHAGFDVQVVSVGSTASYESVGTMSGVTEVPAGTYALMDARYSRVLTQLRPAAKIITTVTSRPEPTTAITDAGQKAVSVDRGLPDVADFPDAAASSLSAEHCRLQLTSAGDRALRLGSKVWLIPADLGTCVNLYDYIHAVRQGRLEAVWNVAARGQYR